MRHNSNRIHRNALKQVLSPPVLVRSLLVAVIVGTILNAINQGSEIMAGHAINFVRLLPTYSVPFCVASYGAFTAFKQQARCDDGAND